jgi:hypothetical protein
VLPQALLFLKALQEIEVYVVGGDSSEPPAAGQQQPLVAGTDPAASGAEEPRLLFRASLKPLDGRWTCAADCEKAHQT